MSGRTAVALALGLIAVAFVSSLVNANVSIGTLMERDYTVYTPLPTTAEQAASQGWVPLVNSTYCEPGLGVPYTQGAGTPDESKPLWLYFTPAGQASGAAVMYYDHIEKQPQHLINLGFIVPTQNAGEYYVSVGFRSPTEACSYENSSLPLGDRLVVHPQGIAHSLPVTTTDAGNRGWVPGSCFQGMGRHWFRDLSNFGSLTWQADTILPIVLMFNEDGDTPTYTINAFFFASTVVQQTLVPHAANQWEPIPLPNVLMCKNLCNSSCTFSETEFWSTLHIYMNDRAKSNCPGGCTFACC